MKLNLRLFFFWIYILTCSINSGVSQTTFQKTIGGVKGDAALSAIPDSTDNGFLVCGYTASYGQNIGQSNILILKIDSVGTIVWSKNTGDVQSDRAFSINHFNSTIVVCGVSSVFSPSFSGILYLTTDEAGTILNKMLFADSNFLGGVFIGQASCITKDGGIVVVGKSDTFNTNDDLYLIKFSAVGDTIFTRKFYGAGNDVATSIVSNDNGELIIGGYTSSFGSGNQDFLLMKFDSSGNQIWSKCYGGSDAEQAWSLKATIDGGYVLAGHTKSFGQGNYDMYLVKTDSSGTIEWSKTYGGAQNDYSFAIQQTTDNGYVIAGSSQSFDHDTLEATLIKTDSQGTLLWSKKYGGSRKDQFTSVIQTADQGFFLSGWTNSFGEGDYDVYIVKADSEGNSSCNEGNLTLNTATAPTVSTSFNPLLLSGGNLFNPSFVSGSGGVLNIICFVPVEENEKKHNEFSISPNPVFGSVVLKCPPNSAIQFIFELSDVTGRILMQNYISNEMTLLDTSWLATGVYFCRIYFDQNHFSQIQKLIVIQP